MEEGSGLLMPKPMVGCGGRERYVLQEEGERVEGGYG
jgi:hypothetical protein